MLGPLLRGRRRLRQYPTSMSRATVAYWVFEEGGGGAESPVAARYSAAAPDARLVSSVDGEDDSARDR